MGCGRILTPTSRGNHGDGSQPRLGRPFLLVFLSDEYDSWGKCHLPCSAVSIFRTCKRRDTPRVGGGGGGLGNSFLSAVFGGEVEHAHIA